MFKVFLASSAKERSLWKPFNQDEILLTSRMKRSRYWHSGVRFVKRNIKMDRLSKRSKDRKWRHFRYKNTKENKALRAIIDAHVGFAVVSHLNHVLEFAVPRAEDDIFWSNVDSLIN